jgi:hypothetical protein
MHAADVCARLDPTRADRLAGRLGLVEVIDVEDELAFGDAQAPTFERCASPHSCTWRLADGVVARSAA